MAKTSDLKSEVGLSVIELIIGLTIFFLMSIGVFQLFKLGYQAVNQTSITASKNATSGNFSNLLDNDMSKSSGFVVSSVNAKKSGICSSWNSENVLNYQDFSLTRPLLTTYIQHSAIINSAKASATSIEYFTNAAPDFKVGQTVEINGLSSATNDNFNFIFSDNAIIQTVNKTGVYSFTVQNKFGIPSGTVTSSANGLTNNGVAISLSYVGYELRYPKLIEPNLPKTQLWRVTCQQLGQLNPDFAGSIKLRDDLPVIDTKTGSNCLNVWTDWGCAIKCVQVSNVEGQSDSPFSDICPTDVFLSSGNRSFTTYVGKGGISNSEILYLSNSSNTSSGAQVGMSVNFDSPNLNDASIREFITAVDLTDPSGDAVITVKCINSNNTGSQVTVTCPVPSVGTPITLAATVFVTCVESNNVCPYSGGNTLEVTDTSLLTGGMYIDFPNGYGVLADTFGSFGSQTITFSSYPSISSMPIYLQFHKTSALQFWIPASSDPKSGDEQKVVAGRATA